MVVLLCNLKSTFVMETLHWLISSFVHTSTWKFAFSPEFFLSGGNCFSWDVIKLPNISSSSFSFSWLLQSLTILAPSDWINAISASSVTFCVFFDSVLDCLWNFQEGLLALVTLVGVGFTGGWEVSLTASISGVILLAVSLPSSFETEMSTLSVSNCNFVLCSAINGSSHCK